MKFVSKSNMTEIYSHIKKDIDSKQNSLPTDGEVGQVLSLDEEGKYVWIDVVTDGVDTSFGVISE